MTGNPRKAAFALPLALVLTFCAVVLLGGVLSYVSSAARLSAIYAGKSACRLAAVSALEKVRGEVYHHFLSATGVKTLLLKRETLDWFKYGCESKKQIGRSNPVDFDGVVQQYVMPNFPDLTITVRVQRQPEVVGMRAIVTFFATAEKLLPSGGTARATVAERVSYGIDRSKVFDHAYFVNNYGWFEGSTITANGDVRANGDMSLSNNPKVNGHVFGAYNEELGVPGQIRNGTANMDSKATYRGTQYGTRDRARPLHEKDDDGGYEAPVQVTEADKAARLHGELPEGLDMPWISDLNQYVTYGQDPDIQSTLSQGGVYYVDNRLSNKGGENYGYYTGTGPSGNAALPDNHALVLVGTSMNPIVLNGPVVVSNDVIIKGVVTGQGTIYSQRNIHIIGDITYKNPPNWAGKAAAVNNENSKKDLLGLAAKGNIVLGDPTSSSWLNATLKNCISTKPYVQQYICAKNDDGSWGDGDIGYPRAGEDKFCGNYTVTDGGSMVKEQVVYKKDRYGRNTTQVDHYTYSEDRTRKYYNSVVAAHEINSRASTIKQIDAVLYNNHGIFGHIDACSINGSLVCRNEGIIFSGSLNLNWDYRLYSGSPESVANSLVGMPVAASLPTVLTLQEVPDDWNR